MTGVTPLPAVRNSSFGGVGDGRVNSPSTSPSVTIDPAAWELLKNRETTPSSVRLTVIVICPSGRGGVAAQRVRAPLPLALDVEPDPDVLPGLVADPAEPGSDEHRDGIVGLLVYPLDAAAAFLHRPQRCDQLQIVIDLQRPGEVAQTPDGEAGQPRQRNL